jgi:hypothetical protein
MIDERVLAVVRFIDAVTRLPIDIPLKVSTDVEVKWIRTARGIFAIRFIPGLDSADSDAADATPGSIEIGITVRDPSGQYLARRRTLRLPRDADVEHADDPAPALPADLDPDQDATVGSLFKPLDVLLFPAPRMQVAPGWAVVRATITGDTPDSRLAHALVRVLREDDDETTHLGNALADDRGEALVAVTGIPATSFNGGSGPVMLPGANVTLEIVFDPSAPTPPDPFDLEQRHEDLLVRTIPLRLVPGRVLVETL